MNNRNTIREQYLRLNPDLATLLDELNLTRMDFNTVLEMRDPEPEHVEKIRAYLDNMEGIKGSGLKIGR